jgi:3-hydroxybutyryl-CoA dehydrogenase
MDAKDVKKVVVVGAGVMGNAIAHVFSQAGIEVRLVDLDEKRLEQATGRMSSSLKTLAEYGKIARDEISAVLERIKLSTDIEASAKGVDFAVEAVSEVPDVKKKVFSQLEKFCPEDTVIASNTSGLDIFSIAEIERPERLVTAHWYAPPHIIPLVEVAPGPKTSPEVVTFTAALMEMLGKKPMIMKEFVPGFIVNKIQNYIAMAYFDLLNNGIATPEEIDTAVKNSIGIRLPIVGVVQLIDFTGLDLVLDIAKSYGVSNPFIEEKVQKGHLGAKTSKGIYDYGKRSEEQILQKRDELYLKVLNHLETIHAFEPV